MLKAFFPFLIMLFEPRGSGIAAASSGRHVTVLALAKDIEANIKGRLNDIGALACRTRGHPMHVMVMEGGSSDRTRAILEAQSNNSCFADFFIVDEPPRPSIMHVLFMRPISPFVGLPSLVSRRSEKPTNAPTQIDCN